MSLLISIVAVAETPEGPVDLDSVDGPDLLLRIDPDSGAFVVHNGSFEYDTEEIWINLTTHPVHFEVRVLNTEGTS